jgi:hypothetical protein
MSEFIVNDNQCALHVKTDNCTPPNILFKLAGKLKSGAAKINNNIKNYVPGMVDKTPIYDEEGQQFIKENNIDTNNPQIKNATKEIVEKLKKETNCTTELCVINSSKVKNILGYDLVQKILDIYFKKIGPKCNVEKWLSNEDIDKTLEQWTYKYKNFYPIPFQMRDFEKNNTELATLDYKNLYNKGFVYFACVPNTDWSSGGGQHWFALFFDFSKEPFTLEYFNSSGELPLPEFNSWLNKSEQQLQNKFKKPVKKEIVTDVQNQYDNSSCGCYSLYYIYSRLNGIPMEWFRNNTIEDEKMHDFRKFLFNTT